MRVETGSNWSDRNVITEHSCGQKQSAYARGGHWAKMVATQYVCVGGNQAAMGTHGFHLGDAFMSQGHSGIEHTGRLGLCGGTPPHITNVLQEACLCAKQGKGESWAEA